MRVVRREDDMKKVVIIVLGLGLMVFGCESPSKDGGEGGAGGAGGTGGSGGTTTPCTDNAECEDANVCTVDFVDPDTSECSNLPVQEETECMFMGSAGLCSEGACAPFCEAKDCSDGNDCTQDNCDSMLGTCSNPNEADETACMVGTDPGECQSGVCVGLCADAETRCDDNEECTLDDCTPADGVCSYTPRTGQTCDFSGAAGICTDQGVCEAAGMCADAAERCTANADNECANDTCDPDTGACGSENVANDTACANDAGTCQEGTCVPNAIEAIEFLAIDCELLANSAPLPVGAKVTPLDLAFAGQSVDVVVEDAIILPAPLVCNFLEADFTSSEVDNSVVGNAISNANITSVTLNSFLVDGTAGNARVSPHEVVLFDFATACGCTDPANPPDPDTCGTGPGIVAPTFVRDGASETIPPGPTPFPITPTAAGTVDFTIPYADLALDLKNLTGSIVVPVVCVGGACGALDICSEIDRGGIASPRIMYDATCNKAQAAAGDCIPFLVFTDVADVCKGVGVEFADAPDCCDTGDFTGMDPTRPIDVNCQNDANRASCCAALATDYPTATAAQQPRLPVSAAP
jgi:hypothetical protein